ncbi:MAG: protein-disulfide reductase DsbD N-terminal domain-containing protein [Gammaproteobacteria bacterium]|nr:protein-disulfide reductase DsbD N-terminal domain-containing protein [Gammaproteobacteria bacterium]MDP2142412.1 protein-disulfide reductase DsbD N-terminal domain-containing protein [Gammaproteobacteria bacterium]MDP2348653.1 protein-disulfide reductase DsbD N-terminal domain-containing protein [Gammaproteobacteria bacterium]
MQICNAATGQRTASYLLALICLFLTTSLGVVTGAYAQGLPGSGGGLLAQQSQFLPVDEAFIFYTSLPEQGIVVVHWTVAPDYYLYREKFAFALGTDTDSMEALEAELPAGVAHHDEFFGDVEVYYGQVAARLQIPQGMQTSPILLMIEYQGCSELGLCYPPQRREIELSL